MPLYKFTPDLMKYEELERLSVGREGLISEILRRIADHAMKKLPAYLLIIGPRGIGKSHLLLRIYYKIKNDPQLSKLIHPIKLSEEEYSVYRLSDLFSRILEEEGVKDFSAKEEELIVDRAVRYLKELKDGKMPLLLMDNMHLIFNQLGAEELKRFRSILQEENFLMILGTASSVFGEISDYDKPFYDFFEIRFLKDLLEEEVEELTKKKLEFEGREDLVREFDKLKPRIKAIFVLTGGNPRLILMICDLLCRPEKLEDIEKSLFGLLDELTPFYQARMETFPSQQRMIFDTLALAEGPLSPTEIATKARIDVNIINVQLKRLEEAGYVEPIKLRRKKVTPYEIKERLFRIWREMRSPLGSKRIRLFVRFLKLWYTPRELIEAYDELVSSMDKAIKMRLLDEMRKLAIHACYLQEAIGPPSKYGMFIGLILRLTEIEDFATAEKEISERKAMAELTKDGDAIAITLAAEAAFLNAKKEFTKAKETVETALKIDPSCAWAWIIRGGVLLEMGHYDNALKSFDDVLKRSNFPSEKHEAYFGKTMIFLEQDKYNEALDNIEKAIETYPECAMSWDIKSWILANMKRYQEALQCNDKALKLASDEVFPWYTRAYIHYEMKDYKTGLEMIDKCLNIEPLDERLLNRKAHLLIDVGKKKKAMEYFKKSLEIAKNRNNLDIATSSATHIFDDYLSRSSQSIANGNFERGQRLLEKALDLKEYFGKNQESFRDIFLEYLSNISHKGHWKFIESALNLIEKKLSNEDKEMFAPFFKAIEYIQTKNVDILESLQKEARQIVVSIVRTLSPDIYLPKELE